MADSIHLDREFTTNGVKIPAGKISTDDLRGMFRDDKGQPLSEDAAKDMQQDLLRRQAKYATYSRGIHERTEVTYDGGPIAVGGGAE